MSHVTPGFSGAGHRCAYRRLAAAIAFLCIAVRAHAQPAVGAVTLTPGWATFGQALPQGAAAGALKVGTLATQTDVKTTWPDGSIRFAVVTVNAPGAATYPITAIAAAGGAFTPTLPTASVDVKIGTATYSAALPASLSSDRWLSGPLVYEGRSVVTPLRGNGTAHPFLRVNFDTRIYNDNTGRVDISVENVLDVAGAATVTYDATVRVAGQAVYTHPAVQHFYLTRWRKTFALTGSSFAAVTPDVAPFNAAGALPPFLSTIANVVSTATGANFDVLKAGALDPIMADHGGRAELAPLPDWTARYLVHRDATQRAFVLANGDLSGSWPIHMREPESGPRSGVGPERMVSIDQRPNLWLDERAQAGNWDYIKGTPLPMREYGTDIPGPNQSPLLPDNAHQPSLAYAPYLLTGDRYYAEEMAFWANYGMVRTYPGDGIRGSLGILENNETRGFGWALRNLADAAAYYPESSPLRAYLAQKVVNNLAWLDDYAASQNPVANPFQILWINRRPDGGQFISMWEQTYVAYAIDRANQQGFVGGAIHRNAIGRFHQRLFTSDPDYPKAQAAAYLLAVGQADPNNPAVLGSFYGSMSEIWTGTQGQERPFAGFYGPEARINLMYGIRNGWPGAQEAYDYLWPFIGATPAGCVSLGGVSLTDLSCRAGWALDFTSAAAPTPAPAEIINPPAGATLTSASQVFNWNTGVGVSSYQLTVGTSPGANDLYSGAMTTGVAAVVSGLPTTVGTVYARLSSLINGTWQFVDHPYATAGTSRAVGTIGVGGVVYAEGYSPLITPPFNTAAGDLVVAFLGSSGPAGQAETNTVEGGGLTWTLARRVNGQDGVAEIWSARSSTALSGITVTSTPALGN
ncbi:MAG TPA: hypothetical protein VNG89_03610, partial [Vicinamibacterales bacterium]|nr:hypothetical protein [Vicinamibacterales bacterium]